MTLSWKHGATTARQANLPQNIAKRDKFWTQAYPMGIMGTPHQTIVNFDEAGIFLETTDHGYGECFIGKDLNEEGPYSCSTKFKLCLAISGDAGGRCWLTFELKKGMTTIYDTITFLLDMMNDLGQGNQPNRHTFICDNLSLHMNALECTMVFTMTAITCSFVLHTSLRMAQLNTCSIDYSMNLSSGCMRW
jgi:hypothetical protein